MKHILYLNNDGFVGGNDTKKLLDLQDKNPTPRGAVERVEVAHYAWCRRIRGVGWCNCYPEVNRTIVKER